MKLLADIQSLRLLYLKAGLFALLALASGVYLVFADDRLLRTGLVLLCVWSSCRFYYFCFYVLEHYAGGGRYAGLWAMIGRILHKTKE